MFTEIVNMADETPANSPSPVKSDPCIEPDSPALEDTSDTTSTHLVPPPPTWAREAHDIGNFTFVTLVVFCCFYMSYRASIFRTPVPSRGSESVIWDTGFRVFMYAVPIYVFAIVIAHMIQWAATRGRVHVD